MNNKITIKSNINDFIKYFNTVTDEVANEVYAKAPNVKRATKRATIKHLTNDRGVDVGVYRKSIVIKNLAKDRYELNYRVGGNKKHYRLTHLLEHGHQIKNKMGGPYPIRSPFAKAPIGSMTTVKVPHIIYGQQYADKAVPDMYEKAIDKSLKGFNPKKIRVLATKDF